MADADADAPVIGADHRVDRAQPVVAGTAAAALDPELARPQVDLVVDHDDLVRRDLVEAYRGEHRFAGGVHEGLRPQQQTAAAANHPFRKLALEAGTESREAVTAGDRLGRDKADIVPIAGVAAARIAEADNQPHRARDAAAITPPALA